MSLKQRRAILVASLKETVPAMKRRVEDAKASGMGLRRRADLLWLLLVQSAATHGNSRGWAGLCADSNAMASIAYSVLAPLRWHARRSQLLKALKQGKVRMPAVKAKRLASNVTLIARRGGVRAATKSMLALQGQESKLKFIREFEGIGEKYGRNIWMDIYDPSFRNCIAVDDRVKKIAGALGFKRKGLRYADYERFFVSIAADAALEPWELDRLLYYYTDHFLYVIRGKPRAPQSVA